MSDTSVHASSAIASDETLATGARPLPQDIRLGRWVFTATIFLGSYLLFLIQPMFARMTLPLLGGAPAVWNTAMVFYQGVLLLGYLYAHAVSQLPAKRQITAHIAVFLAALTALPIGIAEWYPGLGDSWAKLWLMGLFAVSIGLPFFAVSAQAPLMQRWYARTSDPAARDPYFLYAASNIGSLLALISYPLVVEPLFGLSAQAAVWTAGFIVLIALIAASGYLSRRDFEGTDAQPSSDAEVVPAPPVKLRAYWVLLAAIPSALMLSVTTYLTTDIMAAPMLWVIPLGLYLLSFIVVFGGSSFMTPDRAMRLASVAVLVAGALAFAKFDSEPYHLMAGVLILLFLVATALHGEMVRTRPPVQHLTLFYICMSLGGVLGGAFTALAAPLLFSGVYEYPLLLLLSALLLRVKRRPMEKLCVFIERRFRPSVLDVLMPGVSLAAAFAVFWAMVELDPGPLRAAIQLPATLFLFVMAFAAIGKPWRLVAQTTMCALAFGGFAHIGYTMGLDGRERSFFGVSEVSVDHKLGIRRIVHGTTVHGAQRLDPARALEPIYYFSPKGGLGQVMSVVKAQRPDANVGVLGLGVGASFCYATPTQTWTVYEIDPAVAKIAANPDWFTFWRDCAPQARLIMGDARLKLEDAATAKYDVLMVDTFSSDSIPVHLITLEAFQLYDRVVADNGIVIVQISNRFMDLRPVIAQAAAQLGWAGRVFHHAENQEDMDNGITPSTYVVLMRDDAAIDQLVAATSTAGIGWEALVTKPGFRLWTDDYSNILTAMKLFQ